VGKLEMLIKPKVIAGFLACACVALPCAQAQQQDLARSSDPAPSHRADTPAAMQKVDLTVRQGTPLQVALTEETRVKKVGQAIQGRIVEPVYSFDKIVIPVGTEVDGQIIKIEQTPAGRRTEAALDADFTPTRKTEIEFNELILPDGRHLPVHTVVTPGSGEPIQFVSSAEQNQGQGVKDAAAMKTRAAKQQAKQEWDSAMKQVKEPGKLHRIERYAVAQLPVHPQYLPAGVVYFAELQQPLNFGSEPLTSAVASSLGAPPPDGSVVHARLITPLNSASTQKGADVEAMVSQPLFDDGRLILPQGSLLKGSVVQVQPARYMSHNGQLRMAFHELSLPSGVEQKVEATLAGVEAGKAGNLKLDSEGGAQATTSRSRYLATAISVSLAAASFAGDSDAGEGGNPAGNTSNRVAGGAGGYKLIGIALGLAVHSHPLGMAMGAYGGGMSIYRHFIARGHDVVFPKNTAMEIGMGTHRPASDVAAPTK
jgi:hypothetical protein